MWSELIVHVQPALLWLCLFTKNIYLFVVYTEYVPNKPSCEYYNYISLKLKFLQGVKTFHLGLWILLSDCQVKLLDDIFPDDIFPDDIFPVDIFQFKSLDDDDDERFCSITSILRQGCSGGWQCCPCACHSGQKNDQVFVNFGFSLARENQLGL